MGRLPRPTETIRCQRETIRCQGRQFGVRGRQFGVSASLLLPLHQVGKLDSWEDFQDRQRQFGVRRQFGVSRRQFGVRGDNSVSVHHYCFPCIKSVSWETIRCQGRQFGVSASLLLPLHQVGKLDSREDFQNRQAMTLLPAKTTASGRVTRRASSDPACFSHSGQGLARLSHDIG